MGSGSLLADLCQNFLLMASPTSQQPPLSSQRNKEMESMMIPQDLPTGRFPTREDCTVTYNESLKRKDLDPELKLIIEAGSYVRFLVFVFQLFLILSFVNHQVADKLVDAFLTAEKVTLVAPDLSKFGSRSDWIDPAATGLSTAIIVSTQRRVCSDIAHLVELAVQSGIGSFVGECYTSLANYGVPAFISTLADGLISTSRITSKLNRKCFKNLIYNTIVKTTFSDSTDFVTFLDTGLESNDLVDIETLCKELWEGDEASTIHLQTLVISFIMVVCYAAKLSTGVFPKGQKRLGKCILNLVGSESEEECLCLIGFSAWCLERSGTCLQFVCFFLFCGSFPTRVVDFHLYKSLRLSMRHPCP